MATWLAGWNRARGAMARMHQIRRLRPAYFQPIIALLRGLTDPIVGISMGQTAEELAWKFGISREEMDSYAAQSATMTNGNTYNYTRPYFEWSTPDDNPAAPLFCNPARSQNPRPAPAPL